MDYKIKLFDVDWNEAWRWLVAAVGLLSFIVGLMYLGYVVASNPRDEQLRVQREQIEALKKEKVEEGRRQYARATFDWCVGMVDDVEGCMRAMPKYFEKLYASPSDGFIWPFTSTSGGN